MLNKHEEAGFVRATAPHCAVLTTMDASKPVGAPRFRLFAQELLRVNEGWLLQLTAKVRRAVRGLSSNMLGLNGDEFLSECFSETAFAYATIQIMEPGKRFDPKHFDGGASLLHMGITIFGDRMVHLWLQGGRTHILQQSPGSVYIGNMCAVEHQVEHHDELWPQILFQDAEAGSASDGPGLQIAVMLRSDVLRHSRARQLLGKPTPVDVYDLVNDVVSEHLATQAFLLPDFASVARHAVDEEPSSA